MIRFFTKTRKKLLAENKLFKYFKYASGEIILIVAGLLIAVQINNWNEDRKEQIQIKHYLENLVLDFEKDQKDMERLFEVSQFKAHSLQYLLRITGNKPFQTYSEVMFLEAYVPMGIWEDSIPKTYNEEFVKLALIWSQRLGNKTLNTRTIEEMKSLGLFTTIKNEKLKSIIDYYYRRHENSLGEKNQAKQVKIVEKWNLVFENDGLQLEDLWQDRNFTYLRNDTQRIGIIYSLIRESIYVASASKRRSDGYEGLIRVVEKEIEKM